MFLDYFLFRFIKKQFGGKKVDEWSDSSGREPTSSWTKIVSSVSLVPHASMHRYLRFGINQSSNCNHQQEQPIAL
jgi:hypothetical protein